MPEMKTLNGYEIVDAKARADIEGIQEEIENIPDTSAFQTEAQVKALINEALGVIENGSY